MVCLESDFIIAFTRKDSAASLKMEALLKQNRTLFITPITAAELFEGAFGSKETGSVIKLEELLSTFQMLEFDFFASKNAGQLMHELSGRGEKIGDLDTLTAAIALKHNQALVTRNKKHFSKIAGLKIEEW
jgi:predicted nucleic acid-binding protein